MSEIKPCPFCKSSSVEFKIVIRDFGTVGAYGECKECGARTRVMNISETIIKEDGGLSTPITVDSVLRGVRSAIDAWNRRDI